MVRCLATFAALALALAPAPAAAGEAAGRRADGGRRLLVAVPAERPGGRAVQLEARSRIRWTVSPVRSAPGGGAAGLSSAATDELPLATGDRGEEVSQLEQSVVRLAEGGFAVIWQVGAFPARDVRMQLLSDAGGARFGPRGQAVAAKRRRDEEDSAAVASPEGGIFVAFSAKNRVFAQRFDRDGRRRWRSRGVEVARGARGEIQSTPHLVADADGGVYVCMSLLGTGLGIRCQHLDREGQRLWGRSGRMAGGAPGGWRVLPRGVSDGAGGLLVFWRNQRDAFDGTNLPMLMEGQRFAADGTRLWGEQGLVVRTTNLAASNGHGFQFFDVVPDGDGGAVLAFNDFVNMVRPNLDVAAQRVAADGRLLWGQVARVAARRLHHQHETTIPTGDGGAWVVVSENLSPQRSKLRVYRLRANGRHQWPRAGLLVSDPANRGLNFAAFGAFDGERLWLGWSEQTLPRSFEIDVKVARYDGAGARLDPAAGAPVSTAPDGQFLRGLVLSRSGDRALAVWDDRRKGTFEDLDVYGAFVEGPTPDAARSSERLGLRVVDLVNLPVAAALLPLEPSDG